MKRRLVIAFLVGFALWPAVHRWLVARYDVNPWKLAGWAMYVTPEFRSEVALRVRSADGRLRPVGKLTPWEQTLEDEFLDRRYSLGRLASPESLVREVQGRLGADQLVVEIRTRYLDLPTARIRERVERRVYRRRPLADG